MASRKEAEIAAKAMSGDEKPGTRSSLEVKNEKAALILNITATDLGALRATLNSSLREAKIANDMLM